MGDRGIACLELTAQLLDSLVEYQPQLSQDLPHLLLIIGGQSLGAQIRNLIFEPHETVSPTKIKGWGNREG
jgi:hypothetical protein